MKVRWLIPCLLLFLLTGALGFRSIEECADITRPSYKMQCYHTAALTSAYLGDVDYAVTICDDIWLEFGADTSDDDDIKKKAELVSNTCFYDIAKIARDPAICDWIQERYSVGVNLFGQIVTKDICDSETERLQNIRPDEYYSSNPDNLCALVFVLPLLIFGSFSLDGVHKL